MGINGFFPWYRKNFNSTILKLDYNTNIQGIDNFAIDLNGIFHPIAQRVFRYGNYKDEGIICEKYDKEDKIKEVYKEICIKIDDLVNDVSPKKRLFLCIDGIAPFAKQQQQRKRRFKSSLEKNEIDFDPNTISVGTKFMHELSKYIIEHVKKSLENNEKWKNLNVTFSSEKVKGEGEHKAVNYFRKLPDNEVYCIHALDADLILLCLGMINKKKVYVIRDENYTFHKYNLLNIGKYRDLLKEKLNPYEYVNSDLSIYDFIVIISLIGNDFLPTIPCIYVWNSGIDRLIDIYLLTIEKVNKNIVNYNDKNEVKIDIEVLKIFLQYVSLFEKENLENFLNSNIEYFKYEILEKSINEEKNVDIIKFRNLYNTKNFNNQIENVCKEYIKGLEWIISYYIDGKVIWDWFYPYHYSPFTYDMYNYLKNNEYVNEEEDKEIIEGQIFQLMCVLPMNSFYLIPEIFHEDIKNNMRDKYPEKVIIDLEGKCKDYEGVCLIPIIDIQKMKDIYNKNVDNISEEYKELNKKEIDIIF